MARVKRYILILVASASSLAMLARCSTAPESGRILDVRAGYDNSNYIPNLALKETDAGGNTNNVLIPIRSPAKIAVIRIHRQEMPDRAYFWGGWASIEIDQPQWVMTKMTPIKLATPGPAKVKRKKPQVRATPVSKDIIFSQQPLP